MPRLCSWFVWVHMLNSNWHEARRPWVRGVRRLVNLLEEGDLDELS